MSQLINRKGTLGTAPVFMTAISTILGAILFLRFGYAVAHTGFIGTIAIIVIGHFVTVPTALAVAEIATNQKVEGGGAYYMISRSFGINIGAAIGITLFLSQAISVAFYIIAFSEALVPLIDHLKEIYPQFAHIEIHNQYITIPTMAILGIILLSKGSDIGINILYFIVSVLFLSIGMFLFSGKSYIPDFEVSFTNTIAEPDSFFYVFTIIFPAFTGIAAGLGLSGDLKDPKKSIPTGTIIATMVGIVIYVLVAYKLTISGSLEDLDSDQLFMSKIAIWGPIIPIGLACATISSAIGSILVAPRTLQALGADHIFSKGINTFFAKETAKKHEPINATVVTCVIAFAFCLAGDINFVAQIISMFFMVTYGAICLISFLEHFAADPAYRPSFKSRWYISLFGAVLCFWLMFQMNWKYAAASLTIMGLIYYSVSKYGKDKEGLAHIFKGVLFQVTRSIQIKLQKSHALDTIEDEGWRPFVVCISKDSFDRLTAFDMMRWLSHKYGFGTYIHHYEEYLSKDTSKRAKEGLVKLLKMADATDSNVYIDTIISPSYTSAIAQVIQLPGISGKENNMMLFEFSRRTPEMLKETLQNFPMIKAVDFDVCILGSTDKGFGYRQEIHIWITSSDYANANLMILLGYIIIGHPEWKKGLIKIFAIYPEDKVETQKKYLLRLITSGRLPISTSNIELIAKKQGSNTKEIVCEHSKDADLTIVGFRKEKDGTLPISTFEGYNNMGNILFVNATKEKEIK